PRRRARRATTRRATNPDSAPARPQPRLVQLPAAAPAVTARLVRPRRRNAAPRRGARARDELGWRPQRTADQAMLELIAGLRDSAGHATPPLDPDERPWACARVGEPRRRTRTLSLMEHLRSRAAANGADDPPAAACAAHTSRGC